MRPQTILTVLPLLGLSAAAPPLPPSNTPIGTPCGPDIGDCADPLTCIPLSQNCTIWDQDSVFHDGPACRGTCQDLDIQKQKIYTLCGGWRRMDDCDEAVERCVADPRHAGGCGPACDGPGICLPLGDVCGWDTGRTCGEGRECFFEWEEDGKLVKQCSGQCLPLRFGSDTYGKTGREEIITDRWDGWQGPKR
ncbi:hypothetical protein B0T16DRAFT_366814 [Cercophora newfieldiana]|uniref:Uncharacterized protein n=1 Tax=Cercophora newfieldiana TaxID=92897 RepID=A0AA39YT91_9PEZI|nr:hypothetical protein B0T16DRAFT_366814 [Cercophora newfieldiana]